MLGCLSYVDIKKREVPDLAVLALFLYSLFIVKDLKASFIMGGSIFIIQLLLAVVTNGGVGGGDIKLFSVVAFLLGNDLYLLALPMAILMAGTTLYCLITKKGLRYSVPFAPYIFISFLFYWGWILERSF
ncbi:prepilin peptidase [Thermoanaerobacterium sp. DL9XJH110]|uniref:prepilin peptidase n=1 Tax=Thermoanaerobacterium sp. DL9XJH110 TaxID=3386643 RepID=UPI003BB59F38